MLGCSVDLEERLERIAARAAAAGFDAGSAPLVGELLTTLAASKPGGRFLELGTGAGLGTACPALRAHP